MKIDSNMKTFSILFLTILLLLLFISATQMRKIFPHGELKILCDQCHTSEGWQVNKSKIKFTHEEIGFPLSGSHRFTECSDCHKSLIFSFVAVACVDCHTDIHRGQLGIKCENCHTPQNWENRRDIFEQHNRSSFPLIGAHALVDCEGCHYNQQRNEFHLTPIECKSCHLGNFNRATNPDHNLLQFNLTCEECHTPVPINWRETNYHHSPLFTLKDAHLRADCNSCHKTTFSGTTHDCFDCHAEEYNNTSEPNHQVFGFMTKCEICHDASNWENAIFNHVEASGFYLIGIHQNLKCTQCHLNNQVTNLSKECYGCHENDYKGVSDPNHVQNNFDHDCLKCHKIISWLPSTFDHNQTQFPLTDAHVEVVCKDCHSQGFSGISTECYSCHEENYKNTSDPNHVSAQFPVQCENCHNTTTWDETTWDHDNQFFPIYSGEHKGEWNACADCHVNLSNYKIFECINCHKHRQSKMDEEHDEVNGYQYISVRCYECHPKGDDP